MDPSDFQIKNNLNNLIKLFFEEALFRLVEIHYYLDQKLRQKNMQKFQVIIIILANGMSQLIGFLIKITS